MSTGAPDRPRGALLFLTESYPYDIAQEQTFVEPQLTYLRAEFERVVLAPVRRGGTRRVLPDGIEVDESIVGALAATSRLGLLGRAAQAGKFWSELSERPSVLRSAAALRRLTRVAGEAQIIHASMRELMLKLGVAEDAALGYSFWCDSAAVALAQLKTDNRSFVAVSRLNGVDLFEERHEPPYLPLRRFTLGGLDRLYSSSEYGRRYEADRYPRYADRIEVARLGIDDPEFVAAPSEPGTFVVVSCSAVEQVKRVDSIFVGIAESARLRPGVRLEWHHFGDGTRMPDLKSKVAAGLPTNLAVFLHGRTPIERIMGFYRSHAVDLFANASESEGGAPVAIMEAAACGVPIVATSVGGNPEIVSSDNGWLVDPNGGPRAISEAVVDAIDAGPAVSSKRKASRAAWAQTYRADRNYATFARTLRKLRSEQA